MRAKTFSAMRRELRRHRERVEQVVVERRLLADGHGIGGLDRHGPRIHAARPLAQVAPDLAHAERRELALVQQREVADRDDAGGQQPLLAAGPDAGQRAQRQRREECSLAAGRDDDDAPRLAVVAGDLGDRLARAAAERAREPRRVPHRRLDGTEQRACVRARAHEPREVEVALVDADLLDALDEALDHAPDRARALAIALHVGLDEDRARTAPVRLGCAHGRADAEAARLVARRRDDAAAARVAADDERACPAARGGRTARRRRRTRRGRGGRSRPAGAHGRGRRQRRPRFRLNTARTAARRGSLTVSLARASLGLSIASADAPPLGAAPLLERRCARRRGRGSPSRPRRRARSAASRAAPRRNAGRAAAAARCTVPM